MNDGRSDAGVEMLQFLSREELEERVRQRASELENVMDAMPDVLIRLDERGTVSMVNDAVEDVLGYEPSALEGKPIDVILTDPPAESNARMSSVDQLIERLLEEGKVTDVEVYCSSAEGETVPMSLSASMLRDEDGIPSGIVCVAKNIEERKEVERQADFLHSLLRHDLGNRLQVAMGSLSLLRDGDLDEDQRAHADRAVDALEDAVELIEKVRKVDTIDQSESLRPVDLPSTIRGVVDGYDELREKRGVTIETDVEAVSVVAGSLLDELFTNLVENTLVHAGADLLRITTTSDEETVTITVEDDGDGIPPEDREDIFQRGYSEGEGSGSGLGMHIVAELVENYGGEVEVSESSLGGARFDVTLQRADE